MRLSPAEKKALSYAKDRRNCYGEHDKGSRKSIRRKKRMPNRTDRRRGRQTLSGASGPWAEQVAEATEERLLARRPARVSAPRKHPDQPLGEYLEGRLRRRAVLGINDQATTNAAIEKIRNRRRRNT